jgi:hypothetical protein
VSSGFVIDVGSWKKGANLYKIGTPAGLTERSMSGKDSTLDVAKAVADYVSS